MRTKATNENPTRIDHHVKHRSATSAIGKSPWDVRRELAANPRDHRGGAHIFSFWVHGPTGFRGHGGAPPVGPAEHRQEARWGPATGYVWMTPDRRTYTAPLLDCGVIWTVDAYLMMTRGRTTVQEEPCCEWTVEIGIRGGEWRRKGASEMGAVRRRSPTRNRKSNYINVRAAGFFTVVTLKTGFYHYRRGKKKILGAFEF